MKAIEKFKTKNDEERLKDVIILAETGHPIAYEVSKYAIENDPNSSVVMAGLKRITNFHENDSLVPFLEKLRANDKMEKYEPYFSMALVKTGIITMEEFENKLNGN